MSEEIKSKSSDEEATTYEKAKNYWNKVEPTVYGMLGGLPEVGFIGKRNFNLFNVVMENLFLDIQGSMNFLKLLFKYKPSPCRKRALDCGAGIGRVSKNLLMNEFALVDLVEQDTKFCNKAQESLEASGRLGKVYNCGLQDFNETGKYDVIWSQWVLGHLLDEDLVQLFQRLSSNLDSNGMIVVKENFSNSETIVDETDSSVTRPLALFKKLMKQAGLKIIKEARQTNFPSSLFPVYMLAMRPTKK